MATNGRLLSDQLGEVKNTASPALVRSGSGPAVADAIRTVGGHALKFVRAGFRQRLQADIEAEVEASGALQNALLAGITDEAALFEGLSDKEALAMEGTLRDLKKQVGSLENAVAQGLVPQELARSRLDNVVGKAYNKYPGFEEDIQSVLRGSSLGWDPRGEMARRVLGLSGTPKKQEQTLKDDLYAKRLQALLPFAEAQLGLEGVDGVLSAQDPNDARGMYTALEDAVRPHLELERLVAQADTIEKRGEVALPEFRSRVLSAVTNLQTAEVTSIANGLYTALKNMTPAQVTQQLPELLSGVRQRLAIMKGNAEAVFRQRARANNFAQIDDIKSADLAPFIAQNVSQIEAVEQLADAALKDPANAQQYLFATTQNRFMENSAGLTNYAAFFGMDVGRSVAMSPEGQAYLDVAAHRFLPGLMGETTEDALVQRLRAETTTDFKSYWEATQRGGRQAGRAFIEDTPRDQARGFILKADTAIIDGIIRIQKGETVKPDETALSLMDYFEDTNRLGDKAERPVDQRLDFLHMLNNPNVLGKLSPATRAEVKSRSAVLLEDTAPRVLERSQQTLRPFQQLLPDVAPMIMSSNADGTFTLNPQIFKVTGEGSVYVSPTAKFSDTDPEDMKAFAAKNPTYGNPAATRVAFKQMNKALDDIVVFYNKTILPYNNLVRSMGATAQ